MPMCPCMTVLSHETRANAPFEVKHMCQSLWLLSSQRCVPGGGEDEFFFYPNSHGFAYEAAAVTRCLNAGLTECPQYTLDETLRALSLVDAARKAMSEPNSES